MSGASYSTTVDRNHWTLRIIRTECSIMVFSYARLPLIRCYCSRGYMYTQVAVATLTPIKNETLKLFQYRPSFFIKFLVVKGSFRGNRNLT